jgi:dTDP-4-amino-4,6-dideoxygalactose transaminase
VDRRAPGARRGLVAAGHVQTPVAAYRSPRLDRDHIYNQYVVRAERRDALQRFLTARSIGTEVYYPVPFHLQPCFRALGYREGQFPESERAARETLALPVYPELTPAQRAYVVEQVTAFYRS